MRFALEIDLTFDELEVLRAINGLTGRILTRPAFREWETRRTDLSTILNSLQEKGALIYLDHSATSNKFLQVNPIISSNHKGLFDTKFYNEKNPS